MNVSQLIVTLNSEQPERLVAFYKDAVGLEPRFDITPGAFAVGDALLIIEAHSAVTGQVKEPERQFLNFVVADAVAEQDRLAARGVPIVQPAYVEPGIGVFVTFADPDGNYGQLLEFREP